VYERHGDHLKDQGEEDGISFLLPSRQVTHERRLVDQGHDTRYLSSVTATFYLDLRVRKIGLWSSLPIP